MFTLGTHERNMNIRTLLITTWLAMVGLVAPAGAAPSAGAAEDLATWHEQSGKLDCKDCHGTAKPKSVPPETALSTVNQQCIACHGSWPTVAAKLAPRLSNKHINPHASHVVGIECVTCHVGHDRPSRAYCLECHAFEMPMPLGRRGASN